MSAVVQHPLKSSSQNEAAVFLGHGQVRHTRLHPLQHQFVYPVFFLRLNLQALEHQPLPWPLRYNRRGILSLQSCDYGDGSTASLLQQIQLRLQQYGINDADGAIWLHTFPRVWGYVFNPVSFWFCERGNGELRAVLCEVNNTFGERHFYWLAHADGKALRNGETLTAQKAFYVSPFLPVAGSYQFRFAWQKNLNQTEVCRSVARIEYWNADYLNSENSGAGASVNESINNSGTPALVLQTSISGHFEIASTRRLLTALVRMPFLTLGIMVRIHWQALGLWLKRVKFYRHSASL